MLNTTATRREVWQQIRNDALAFGDGLNGGAELLEWAGVFLDELKHLNRVRDNLMP